MEKREVVERVSAFAADLENEGALATDVVFAMAVYSTTGLAHVGNILLSKPPGKKDDADGGPIAKP